MMSTKQFSLSMKQMTNCELPLIVLEQLPDQWAGIIQSVFPKPQGKVTLQLDRFGDMRSFRARPYAPLRTAMGIVPAGWVNLGDHVYLDGDIGDSIKTASWQVVGIDIDWEGLLND